MEDYISLFFEEEFLEQSWRTWYVDIYASPETAVKFIMVQKTEDGKIATKLSCPPLEEGKK